MVTWPVYQERSLKKRSNRNGVDVVYEVDVPGTSYEVQRGRSQSTSAYPKSNSRLVPKNHADGIARKVAQFRFGHSDVTNHVIDFFHVNLEKL